MVMPDSNSPPRYIIVSPVKDEERYVELTLQSVVAQTLRPALWVIVDDGSRDRTAEIVRSYIPSHPFIRLVTHPKAGARQTGSAVIRAFNFGYVAVGAVKPDFVVKLDCDLSFGPEYFERLFREFRDDESLGIASGVYLETSGNGSWKPVAMPSYHAAGASKVLRKRCFDEIGGFIEAAGWDTVDEIRAMSKGWRTTHLAELEMRHHRSEGTGIGRLRTSAMHGEIYCLTRGGGIFFVLKVIHRAMRRPYLIGSMALAWGYLRARWSRKTPLVTAEEAERYQALLSERLHSWTRTLFARPSSSENR